MIEEVDHLIIGGFAYLYEFWTRDGKRKIAARHFETDAESESWFKEKYPNEYRSGVEMRRFDA